MNLRAKTILEAAIKEYIHTGTPASSKELAKRYDFGVRAATIRSELNQLTKDGFLTQLHTSGGRVPTDKGYQFFIAQTLGDLADSRKIVGDRYGKMAGELKQGKLQDFVDAISEETKLLGVGKSDRDSIVYKRGLDSLIENFDSDTKQELQEIIRDFEMLDNRMESLRQKLFSSFPAPQVYLGENSPITNCHNLAVILDNYELDGHRVCIAIIGPKRMNYSKNMKLLKLFHDYIDYE